MMGSVQSPGKLILKTTGQLENYDETYNFILNYGLPFKLSLGKSSNSVSNLKGSSAIGYQSKQEY